MKKEVIIKDVTGNKGGMMWELSRAGVNPGAIIEGRFLESNNAVEFSVNGIDCVAWLGETCIEVPITPPCKIKDVGCPYHACMSDNCQREIVHLRGFDFGKGHCEVNL